MIVEPVARKISLGELTYVVVLGRIKYLRLGTAVAGIDYPSGRRGRPGWPSSAKMPSRRQRAAAASGPCDHPHELPSGRCRQHHGVDVPGSLPRDRTHPVGDGADSEGSLGGRRECPDGQRWVGSLAMARRHRPLADASVLARVAPVQRKPASLQAMKPGRVTHAWAQQFPGGGRGHPRPATVAHAHWLQHLCRRPEAAPEISSLISRVPDTGRRAIGPVRPARHTDRPQA